MKRLLKILIVIFIISLSIANAQAAFDDEKPLFVTITSKWCNTCEKLKPVVEELKNDYEGQVIFITLDPSGKESLEEAKQLAEDNGITEFFDMNKAIFPIVGILCPGGKKVEKSFIGETKKETYTEALDELLSNTSKLCSL